MSRYCNNPGCDAYGRPQEGKHCAWCGELFVDDTPSKSSSSKEYGGDGISVSRVMNDSHDTISNNNTTIVINGKSLEDLSLKERKASYRKFCTGIIENGMITPAVRKKLDVYALELELSLEEKREIERFVKMHGSAPVHELNAFDRDNFDIIKENIAGNQGNINDMLAKLEAMSSYDNDEVQYYYNMLQYISSPLGIIRKYEDREQDTYWLAFWAYVGFLKNGQKVKAEKVLRELTAWDTQAQDNLHLLQATGALIGEDVGAASVFLKKAKHTSYLLRSLLQTASYIITCKGQLRLSHSNEINFILERLYGLTNETPENRIQSYTPLSQTRLTGAGRGKYSWKLLIIITIVAITVVLAVSLPKTKSPETEASQRSPSTTTEVVSGTEKPTSAAPKPKTTNTNTSTASGAGITSSPNAGSSSATASSSSSTIPSSDPVAELKAAADGGNKDSQYALGMKYYEGDGVAKNMSMAFQYLKPLADAGYTKAYFPVAEMYHRGQGVAKDRDAAEQWYQKAADAGNAKAKNILINSF